MHRILIAEGRDHTGFEILFQQEPGVVLALGQVEMLAERESAP